MLATLHMPSTLSALPYDDFLAMFGASQAMLAAFPVPSTLTLGPRLTGSYNFRRVLRRAALALNLAETQPTTCALHSTMKRDRGYQSLL